MSGREPVDMLPALRRQSAALVSHSLQIFLDYDFNQYDILNGRLTGGHVMTHLAREADRMADALLGATGQPIPAPDRGRRWEMSDGGNLRPGAVLVDDTLESSDRLQAAMTSIPDWSVLDDDARAIPAHRLVQVIVHLVDLGRPWEELSDGDAAAAVIVLADVLVDELSDYRLAVTDTTRNLRWEKGDGVIDVSGPPWALLAWATGRTTGGADLPPDFPVPALRILI